MCLTCYRVVVAVSRNPAESHAAFKWVWKLQVSGRIRTVYTKNMGHSTICIVAMLQDILRKTNKTCGWVYYYMKLCHNVLFQAYPSPLREQRQTFLPVHSLWHRYSCPRHLCLHPWWSDLIHQEKFYKQNKEDETSEIQIPGWCWTFCSLCVWTLNYKVAPPSEGERPVAFHPRGRDGNCGVCFHSALEAHVSSTDDFHALWFCDN